jgi:uncharacterized protein YigA (DUF484 family)
MTDAMTDTKKPPVLTEKEVAAWLEAHPNFLQRHPEVLDFLHAPKAVSGKGVADFQAYMVKRLKADRDEVLESAREIIETSRTNMNNQTRIHKCIVALLEARTFEDFIRTITMDMTAMLDVDIVSLIVEAEGKTVPQITLSGVRAVGVGSIQAVMGDKRTRLESNILGLEEIYGGGARLVKSQALLRLDIAPSAPVALIAFGSRDPEFFEPGQGTELITFLGDVAARMMRIWLDFEQV